MVEGDVEVEVEVEVDGVVDAALRVLRRKPDLTPPAFYAGNVRPLGREKRWQREGECRGKRRRTRDLAWSGSSMYICS